MRRLADAAATHEVHDREQHDRTQQRNQERGQRQRCAVDRTTRQDQAADERADDADDDVQENALLRVVRIVSIAESGENAGSPNPPMFLARAAMDKDSTQIVAGEKDVTVTVSVRFLLN